jgi:RNase P/RNase MRP subunit POP5
MPVRSVRRRYLNLHIESDNIKEESLNKLIESKIHFLYGVKGAVEINYKLIEFDPEENTAIIRCNHNRLNEMRVVLASITEAEKKPCRIHVTLVSGTIKSLKKHKV